MKRELVLASAGAGKSTLIVQQALDRVEAGERVLILTYTERNQEELANRFCELYSVVPSAVTIKGWFTFLLEDLIRPYQTCLFEERISGIHFNSSDPHRNGKYTIPGRSEKVAGRFNPRHFLTRKENKAHTTFLSKLAARINALSGGAPIARLSEIYGMVCIDEVQDLTGWDFEVIESIAGSGIGRLCCVGDFRQTLYFTHLGNKKPKGNSDKLARFNEIGLATEQLNISWRCIQAICNFADLVHADEKTYEPTESKLKKVEPDCGDHLGVYVVRPDNAEAYLDKYAPTILRTSRATKRELCEGRLAYNFGESKGMGFNRVLICATGNHEEFLAGNKNAFAGGQTDRAKNALYVAITRARYSAAFLYDGVVNLEGIEVWPTPED